MVQVLMTKSKTASILNLWLASPLQTGDQQYLRSTHENGYTAAQCDISLCQTWLNLILGASGA
jgi:hypothetical protein